MWYALLLLKGEYTLLFVVQFESAKNAIPLG